MISITTQMLTDFGAIHVVLVLWTCRMQELWEHGGFHKDFRRRPGRQGIIPLKEQNMKLKIMLRSQELRDDRNKEHLLAKVAGSECIHPKIRGHEDFKWQYHRVGAT